MGSIRRYLALAIVGILVVGSVVVFFALEPSLIEDGPGATSGAEAHPTDQPEDFGDVPPPEFQTIEPGLRETAEAAPDGEVPVVVIADGDAAAAAATSAGLTRHGSALFTGTLTVDQLDQLDGVAGLVVGADHPTSIDPIVESAASDPSAEGSAVAAEGAPNIFYPTQTYVRDVDPGLPAARTSAGVQGSGQVIAVIDTGVDSAAAGLAGKVVYRQDFTQPSSDCNAHVGKLDPAGHGTHVASIAAGGGVLPGVAPAAAIVDLRVLDCAGRGTSGWVNQALQWVLNNHVAYDITVVNVSLGLDGGPTDGTDPTSVLVNKLVANGVFVAVAAGNSGDLPGTVKSPGTARYATTVGAAGVFPSGSYLAHYSSRGPVAGTAGIDILAAGSSIRAARSTALAGSITQSVVFSGTSMASPYVAGLAALVIQKTSVVPGGTECSVGASCPFGVVESSMANAPQDALRATDLFAPGVDSSSGVGLVSPSKTVAGLAAPTAPRLSVDLEAGGFNFIRIPAHGSAITVSIVTDGPQLAFGEFDLMWVDSQGATSPVEVPCATTANDFGSGCSIGGGTRQVVAVVSPATAQTSWLRLRLPEATHADVSFVGLSGSPTASTGLTADDAALDETGQGEVELVRTRTGDSPSTVDIAATPGITVASQIVLPAGPAGTSVTIPVAQNSGHVEAETESGDRLVLRAGGTIVGLVSIRDYDPSGGQFTAEGRQVTWDGLAGLPPVVAANGTVVGESYQPEFELAPPTPPFYYVGLYVVEPGSTTAERLEIPMTTPAAMSAFGVSADGNRVLVGQLPGGAGLVPGDDDDVRYIYAVRDRSAGTTTEVGSSTIVPRTGSSGRPVLSTSGHEAAFIAHVDGRSKLYLWSDADGSAGLTEVKDLGSSSITAIVRGVTDAVILVEVSSAGLMQPRLYSTSGTLLQNFPAVNAMASNLAADGSAVAYPHTDGSWRCYTTNSGTTTTITPSLGSVNSMAVGAGCSSALAVVSVTSTESVLNRYVGGVATTLARDEWQRTVWLFDPTGEAHVTSTSRPLDPADTNGLIDLYRGPWGAPAGGGGGQPTGFIDVSPDSPFYEHIGWLAEQGISTGYPDGTFRPYASVNRDAMAAFLYRLDGEPEFTPPAVSPFSDVPVSHPFYTEIAWLAAEGISTGYPDGTFRPLDPVARDAMAAFLYRFAESPDFEPTGVSSFIDVDPEHPFYTQVSWLAAVGISTGWVGGSGARSFAPHQSVSREAMAAFMYRLEHNPDQPVNPGDTVGCEDFAGWHDAQFWFNTYFPYYGDVALLDEDGDETACETLPGAP